MAVNGPTLVPDAGVEEMTTTENLVSSGGSIGEQVGMWRLSEVVPIAPPVTGAMAESNVGRGIFVTCSSRDILSGNAWIRRACWWLRTHRVGDVPQLLDHGMASDGRLWMVRSATTPSWRFVLESGGPLPVVPAVRALAAAAESLAPVHDAGWAHKALTLDLVHAPRSGRACISGWGDVGLSHDTSPGGGSESWDADPLARPADSGASLDVGALGHMLLELVTPDARVLRRAGRVSDAVRMALPDPGIEYRVLRHIIGGAVHPDSRERWGDARALASELQTWLDTFGQGRWQAGG